MTAAAVAAALAIQGGLATRAADTPAERRPQLRSALHAATLPARDGIGPRQPRQALTAKAGTGCR